MVTPTYYVYFTSTTIITSLVLFQGFKGTTASIVTMVNGFLTICSGVVLLQLSKSAKDVPDTAVFAGNLDQIHTIAEQEQPETEPKADAIRGTAAIVRRMSVARQKMEVKELERLHEEKEAERLEPVREDDQPQYEWDGLRRRRTMRLVTRRSNLTEPVPSTAFVEPPPSPHPPLGMSHFPTAGELAEHDRPTSAGLLSSIAGTIRSRARSMTGRSSVLPGHPEYLASPQHQQTDPPKIQSPLHPVQLTDVTAVPGSRKQSRESSVSYDGGLEPTKGEYEEAALQSPGTSGGQGPAPPPSRPPHSSSHFPRHQFSFRNLFRRSHVDDENPSSGSGPQEQQPRQHQRDHLEESEQDIHHHRHQRREQGQEQQHLRILPTGISSRGYPTPKAKGETEEERLGLVKEADDPSSSSRSAGLDDSSDDDDDEFEPYKDDKEMEIRYGRGITGSSSPPQQSVSERLITRGNHEENEEASAALEASRRRRGQLSEETTPLPSRHKDRRGPTGGGGREGHGELI